MKSITGKRVGIWLTKEAYEKLQKMRLHKEGKQTIIKPITEVIQNLIINA